MRSQRHVRRFRHTGDFEAFGDAAGMREIGLQNSQAAGLQHPLELKAREHALAGGQRDRGLRRQPRVVLRLLGQHRLFDKQRPIGFQLFNQQFRHRRADAAMKIEAKFNVVAKCFADLRHRVHRRIHRARTVNHPHFLTAVEFEGIKPHPAQRLNSGNDLSRSVSSHPAVGFDFIAHQATQQLPDRRIQRLPFDVPQRLVNTGDRAHQDRSAAIKAGAVHDLPQIVDPRRILANQIVPQLMYRRLHGARPAFDDRLAPADYPLVGFNLEEHPARG